MEIKSDGQVERVLRQLEGQYRIYRSEIRSYNQIAGASGSLFILLLFGELAAAKDNPSMWILIPLTIISYSGLIGNIATFGHMAGMYSALLEDKINALNGDRSKSESSVFQYETDYVGPTNSNGEIIKFGIFVACLAVMPMVLCYYSLYRLLDYHRTTSYVLMGVVPVALVIVYWSMGQILETRKKRNAHLLKAWLSILPKP